MVVTLRVVALVPEIRLYQADESADLWELAGGGYASDEPPPFWAFAWAGGQALARYVLDHPETVAGRHVLDLATGSGLVAIAAARAGATRVTAVDVDPAAVAATARNAAANGVPVEAVTGDVDAAPGGADVLLAADACYTRSLARRVLAAARRAARAGASVLVADADRGFLPTDRLRLAAAYRVPTPGGLEERRVTPASVWAVT